jgi:hypothetical protein
MPTTVNILQGLGMASAVAATVLGLISEQVVKQRGVTPEPPHVAMKKQARWIKRATHSALAAAGFQGLAILESLNALQLGQFGGPWH